MSGRDKAINHKQSSLSVDAEFSNQEKDYHGFISSEVHLKKKGVNTYNDSWTTE